MVITMSAIQEARAIRDGKQSHLVSALTASFAIGQILGPMSVSLLIYLGEQLASGVADRKRRTEWQARTCSSQSANLGHRTARQCGVLRCFVPGQGNLK